MAPSRGKGKAKVYPLGRPSTTSSPRRTPRAAVRRNNDGVPGVYKDMLAEATAENSDDVVSDRPLKKRKVTAASSKHASARQDVQTIEDSSASSDHSDESEFNFEDVELSPAAASSPAEAKSEDDGIADVSIAINHSRTPKQNQTSKRKVATPAEKAHRVAVHKLHILCLLGHLMYVNTWCNDATVHDGLLELLSNKTRSYLTHNPEHSQFQQNRSFMDGLHQAAEAWRGVFQITTSGLRRPGWAEAGREAVETDLDPLGRDEFRRGARELEGSQDSGNQLFCALLRAIGVEARVVCSLQVLPFGFSSKDKMPTPAKGRKQKFYATASGVDSPVTDSNTEDSTVRNSSTVGRVPSARRRLAQPSFPTSPAPATITPKKNRVVRKLTYPIFWVEAFNRAHQTWVPVDPLVTQTVGKASKLEPPSSYEWNQMLYVIALESDGVARDVTKRYTKAYNAKTRRFRVESAEHNGTSWLKRALQIFRRPSSDEQGRVRDQIEDSQLAQREAQEGLPNNVQDFKHHPYYALERHLRRHEVINPRREVGKVNAGTAAKPRMEVVFRRGDVQSCKSAEKWFRVGREVKQGEQPLKRVPARRNRSTRAASEESEVEQLSALYALFQTDLYIPPPVVKGKVPRNAYGNLDVYVPSMVPPGGAHIRHPLAKEAAHLVRIDAVDAVTGFKFQGRQGTAVIEGVIVAAEYRDAVEAAIDGLQDDQVEQESMARSALALKMWRRFLTELRIKERVSAYGDGTSEIEDADMTEAGNDSTEAAGGFLAGDVEILQDEQRLPTAGKYSLADLQDATSKRAARVKTNRRQASDESEEAQASDDQSVGGQDGGFEPAPRPRRTRQQRKTVVDDESEDEELPISDHASVQSLAVIEEGAGGFASDDGMEGGFMVEDDVKGDTEHDLGSAGDGGFMIDEEALSVEQQNSNIDAEQPSDNMNPQSTHADRTEPLDIDYQEDSHMRDRSATPRPRISMPACDGANSYAASNTFTPPDTEQDTTSRDEPARTENESSTSNANPQSDWQVHSLTDAEQQVWPAEANDDSDRGSMLSHDPEDEDAEPDWLESD